MRNRVLDLRILGTCGGLFCHLRFRGRLLVPSQGQSVFPTRQRRKFVVGGISRKEEAHDLS